MSDADIAAVPSADMRWTIGAASQITGIPEATLRVWERRYHFPQSARSAGGHRHYSHQEVLHLRWVKMQMDMGMRASRAIRERALMPRDVAVANALHEPVPPPPPPDPHASALQALLFSALLAFDTAKVATILDHAVSHIALPHVVLEIVGPTLSTIGDAWASGKVDVAVEHYATNLLRHHLLDWMRASPAPHTVRPVALACAPEEMHEGSLLMLGVLLCQLRWPVVYLGQSLPLVELEALAQGAKPAMIVFVAMSEPSARSLAEWPHWLQKSSALHEPIIAFGGRVFTNRPELAMNIPGAHLGATLYEGCQRINRVMLHLAVLGK